MPLQIYHAHLDLISALDLNYNLRIVGSKYRHYRVFKIRVLVVCGINLSSYQYYQIATLIGQVELHTIQDMMNTS